MKDRLPKIEQYYQRQAKDFVDMMYGNKLLSPDFSRDDMQTVEDYVAYLLQSGAESAAKMAIMLKDLSAPPIQEKAKD